MISNKNLRAISLSCGKRRGGGGVGDLGDGVGDSSGGGGEGDLGDGVGDSSGGGGEGDLGDLGDVSVGDFNLTSSTP